MIECRLGFLKKSHGSVFIRKLLPPQDPIFGDSDRRCAGYIITVQGPAALESPRNELYDRATLKVHVSSLSAPPSIFENELAHKVKSIFSQVIRLEDMPRTGVYIGVQPLGTHDFELLVNSITLALLDAAITMRFVPVCVSSNTEVSEDCAYVINIQTGDIIYNQKNGIAVSSDPSDLDRALVEERFKWIIERMSEKQHSSKR